MATHRRIPEALDERFVATLAGEGPSSEPVSPTQWEALHGRGRPRVDSDALIASAAVHVAGLLVLSIIMFSADVPEICTLLAELSSAREPAPSEPVMPGPGLAAEIHIEPDTTVPVQLSHPPEEDSDSSNTDLEVLALASGLEAPLATEGYRQRLGRRGGRLATAATVAGDRGTGDGPRTAEYFGTVATGERFVYVLDMSGSMAEPKNPPGQRTRFDRAVAELLYSLDRLHPDQMFYIVLFSDKMKRMFDESAGAEMLAATPENRQRLAQWIASIEPRGGTHPLAATRFAMSLNPDAVFMLSDGDFNGWKPRSGGDMFRPNPRINELLGQAERRAVPIHSFAFEDPQAKANMEALASLTGGRFRYLEPPEPEEKRPQTPADLLAQGDRLREAGRVGEALAAYRYLITHHPLDPAAPTAFDHVAEISKQQDKSEWNRR